MAIPFFLAMTGEEFRNCAVLPAHAAWMDCVFSPDGDGIIGLPPALPPNSLLMLTDRIPLDGQDPVKILEQLCMTIQALKCRAVILDLQRPDIAQAQDLCACLTAGLPCPVVISEPYAKMLDCPVLLSPCPHHVPLKAHIAPWSGRQLWLDLATDAQTVTITTTGSRFLPLPPEELPELSHYDTHLHCHYAIGTAPDAVRFTFWRTREDCQFLTAEAQTLGIEAVIGLFCELGTHHPPSDSDENTPPGREG